MIIGALFIIVLIALASWQLISRWQVHSRLKVDGLIVQALVTDIKSESRLVTQTGGATSTAQRLKYEDFLYAQWQDPITQHVRTFRIKISDFHQFHLGEVISIRMNRKNPNEYQIEYSTHTPPQSTPVPKMDSIDHEYQQGYRSSIEQKEAQRSTPSDLQEYEEPKASYPQQLLEQKNNEV